MRRLDLLQKYGGQSLAKWCAVYSGLIFGIYWIPLRALDAAGFSGIWATSVFNLSALVLLLPLLIWRWRRLLHRRLRFHIIAISAGLSYVFYAAALLYTDVISVIILFYLMPVWGFLLAKICIGDAITPLRWASMVIALLGLLVILGEGSTLPLPDNIGDWMALAAGAIWAGIALMLLTEKQVNAVDITISWFFWSAVLSVVMAIIASQQGLEPLPQWRNLLTELRWLAPFALVVIIPAGLATMYSPTKLNPGIVGLLFMTEISVGTITAAIWAGEHFGSRQLIGVVLITGAGVLETAWLYCIARYRRSRC